MHRLEIRNHAGCCITNKIIAVQYNKKFYFHGLPLLDHASLFLDDNHGKSRTNKLAFSSIVIFLEDLEHSEAFGQGKTHLSTVELMLFYINRPNLLHLAAVTTDSLKTI